MEQVKYIPFEEIFNLQDRVLQRAIANHKAEWDFVKDCIELVINRVSIEEHISDLNGTNMPTVGVALDPERTKKYLHEIMRASLYMIRILTDFYSTKPELISEYFFVKKEELEKRFSAFRSLGKSKIPQ